MPTATDLVTDLPADFAAFGQPVDTTLKALNPSTTLGDIEYRSATANTNTRLGIGSTGNVLTVAGGVPTWAAPAGGGKMLQVITGETATTVTSTSATYADTNLTATITPSSATSTILVTVHQYAGKVGGGANESVGLRLYRGATLVKQIVSDAWYTGVTSTVLGPTFSYSYLDSPSSTSAIVYKTQFNNNNASGSVRVQPGTGYSSITLIEVGA